MVGTSYANSKALKKAFENSHELIKTISILIKIREMTAKAHYNTLNDIVNNKNEQIIFFD